MTEGAKQYRQAGSVVDRHLLYLAGMIENWLKRDADFGILITDEALIIRFCNGWVESRAVRAGKYPLGNPLLEVFPELTERGLDRLYREALEGRTQVVSERFHRYLLAFPADAAVAARSPMLQAARIYPLTENGSIAGTLTVIEDVTSRVFQERELRETVRRQEELIEALRHAENWLYEVSVTDELTGLYNRRGFLTLAEQQLRIAERTKRGFSLLFADLDGLKWINDRLGHTQGDTALQDMAAILKHTFRESDITARMGGDEYAVLALEARRENAEILTENLRREITLFNRTQSRPYLLSASLGTVFCDPTKPTDLETLLGMADRLMYDEKQRKHRDVSAIIRP